MLQLQVWQSFFHHYPSFFASSCSCHAVHLVLSFFHLISGFSFNYFLFRSILYSNLQFQVKPKHLWYKVFAGVWLLRFYLLKEIVIPTGNEYQMITGSLFEPVMSIGFVPVCLLIIMSYWDLAELFWWEELVPCAKCCTRVTLGVSAVVRTSCSFPSMVNCLWVLLWLEL